MVTLGDPLTSWDWEEETDYQVIALGLEKDNGSFDRSGSAVAVKYNRKGW